MAGSLDFNNLLFEPDFRIGPPPDTLSAPSSKRAVSRDLRRSGHWPGASRPQSQRPEGDRALCFHFWGTGWAPSEATMSELTFKEDTCRGKFRRQEDKFGFLTKSFLCSSLAFSGSPIAPGHFVFACRFGGASLQNQHNLKNALRETAQKVHHYKLFR